LHQLEMYFKDLFLCEIHYLVLVYYEQVTQEPL